MKPQTKLVVLLALATLALLAALPYRKPVADIAISPNQTHSPRKSTDLVYRQIPLHVSAAEESPATELYALPVNSGAKQSSHKSEAPLVGQPARIENHRSIRGDSPPSLPEKFEPLLPPFDSLLGSKWAETISVSQIQSEVQRTREVRHRVNDGDTLRSLAMRYLGRENGAQIIYEANRDRLPQPEALPIGEVLVIPVAEPVDRSKEMDPSNRLWYPIPTN